MAITISSLTPTTPTASAGDSVLFVIAASDNGGLTLTYEWQYSTDGVNYTSAGLSNNTSSSYDTGPLTLSANGIYYRCVVSTTNETVNSNEYAGIGDRTVLVYQDPSILIELDSTVDYLPTSQVKTVGDTLVLTMSASLANVDVSNNTLVSNISFTWQVSNDSGSTWSNIVAGGNTTITEQTDLITGTTNYLKYSTLSISNLTFNENLYQYRVRVAYTGAINTPVDSTISQLIIDPVINIITQPGVNALDTQTTNCYKTSITDSGDVRVSVAALTTVGTGLSYVWEMNFSGQAGENDPNNWIDVGSLTANYMFILKPGTTATSDILELERLIYFDEVGFRCVISGNSGEATVTTTYHYINMTDVEGDVDVSTTSIDIVEDKYGDIANRNIYSESVQSVILNAEVDIQRNTGQNGNNTFTWQRKNPGSSTWTDITNPAPVTIETESNAINYTQFPNNLDSEIVELSLETPPLRRDIDNGAKYRVKVESSSRYTLSGSTKTIIPYYSDEITLNVYPTVYIINQPIDGNQYASYSTAFSVTASPSSGNAADITYQWQYNTTNAVTGWVDITNSTPYSGATSNLMTINPIPSTLTYPYYRCVMSITNGLSSVTTNAVQLYLITDYFTALSSLNDAVVLEFSNHTFSVTASSISAGPISFQWEKSTDFNATTATGTWSAISGETTSSLILLSVSTSNEAFYRVKCTSSGGETLYSNAAQLTVQDVSITVTKDISSTTSVLEAEEGLTFECEGFSSVGTEVAYQWQIKRSGDASFTDIGPGFNNTIDTNRIYVFAGLSTDTDDDAEIRCKLTAPNVPGQVYTTVCTLSVNRRFTYFAGEATKEVTEDDILSISLDPLFTGGTPTYSWVEGTSNTPVGQTTPVLSIPNIDSSYNGKVYKCLITLDKCTQHKYSRANVTYITPVSGPTYTVSVTISVTTKPSVPTYYSTETAKSGAAIGTVICIPKPADYVAAGADTGDDAHRWGCGRAGTAYPGTLNTSSRRDKNNKTTYHDGDVWTANKPSWADDDYISPKWLLSKDRFHGYIEMRGQTVRASEFPELARHFGTKFGGTITGSYPDYAATDTFELPMTYAKRLMGTGNVNNNSGSTSVVPTFDPDGTSGGDKNVPGSMGGVYNYIKSAQLPPGSPGVAGEDDGTADGFKNAATFSIGSYRTTGMQEVNAFVQPTFSGTVNYSVGNPASAFTDLPVHSHTAVSVGWRETQLMISSDCAQANYPKLNPGGPFHETQAGAGQLQQSTTTKGEAHSHVIDSYGPGTFDMVKDAGMGISDTTLRFTGATDSIMNNNLSFYLRNNEKIPMNAPYFRLKYLIKAY